MKLEVDKLFIFDLIIKINMYLPKSKYSIIVAKPGQYTLNGKEYVGPVLVDYRGKTYAGSDPSNIKGEVIRTTVDPEPVREVPAKIVPTEEDYGKGFMIRYFRQDNRSKKVDEIASGSAFSNTRYAYASASWILTGSLDDREYQINGRVKPVIIRGVRYKNEQTIQEMDKILPGISGSGILSNPEEFVLSLKKS